MRLNFLFDHDIQLCSRICSINNLRIAYDYANEYLTSRLEGYV